MHISSANGLARIRRARVTLVRAGKRVVMELSLVQSVASMDESVDMTHHIFEARSRRSLCRQ